MKKIKQNVIRFLGKYQMDHLDIDFDKNVNSFLGEMERGLAGKKNTLDMIPTYIEVGADVPANKPVIVADAGGTNFRVATVYFDDQKKPVIENLRLFKMPGSQNELSKDEFFKVMAGYFKDVNDAAKNIGFCFSYAVEILPNKDGRLIRFSKEVKARGVEGQLIGENLNLAMTTTGLAANKHIVLLNDTVATLLAGVGYKNKTFGSYIGFILGTGTNTCYIEKNSNIKKTKGLNLSKSQIINTESGGLEKFHRGKIDIAYDKTTTNPGVHKFEKMISGAYLGPLCLSVIHTAAKEKLFSKKAGAALEKIEKLETKDMNEFMLNPLVNACKTSNDDVLTIYYIADRLTERAAKLTAINLSAMAIKSGQGTDPSRPICIVAEGTTFYQMKGLKPRTEFYLKQYLENKLGIYCEIVGVENATLIGAAIAGLTN
jgi:hexokinase